MSHKYMNTSNKNSKLIVNNKKIKMDFNKKIINIYHHCKKNSSKTNLKKTH